MSKIKGALLVIVLVGAGGAATFFWLTMNQQQQVLDQATRMMEGADQRLLSVLKVQTFEVIQALSAHSRSETLLNPLLKLPAGIPADDSQKSALTAVRTDLTTALDEIHKKASSDEFQKSLANEALMVLSTDGKIVAQIPDKEKFGASLKGLPVVEECLQGTSRDGIFELDDKLKLVEATPLLDKSGKIAGCLAAASEISPATLIAFSKPLGMELAVFIHKTIVVSTMDNNVLEPLFERLDSKEPIWFGEPSSSMPWFVNLAGKAYLARSIPLPSGTDPLFIGAIVPVAERMSHLGDIQHRLLLGVGILFIIGMLVVFFFGAEQQPDKDLERLREGVKTMLEGDKSFTLDAESYVGPYRELARDIAHLASVAANKKPISPRSDSLADLLGALPSTEQKSTIDASGSEALDFNKLLDSTQGPHEMGSTESAEPLPTSLNPSDFEASLGLFPASVKATEPIGGQKEGPPSEQPTVSLSSPAMPFASSPAGEAFSLPKTTPAHSTTTPAAAPSGPRTELPSDLVGIFEERIDTREIKPLLAKAATWPEHAAQSPRSDSPPQMEPTRPVFTSSAAGSLKIPTRSSSVVDSRIEDQITSSDFRPDETIIAAVPDELLRASSGADILDTVQSAPTTLPKPPSISMPPSISLPPISNSTFPAPGMTPTTGKQTPLGALGSEESHFREIFEQFVNTKKQCGESTAGLSFDPFAEKLRKNTAELKGRYKCSTVKFQVYVKNGKAALKATPIK